MPVIVDIEKCTGCRLCVKACPYGSVEVVDKIAVISETCISCGSCIESCPTGALASDLPPRELADAAAYSGVWVWAEQRSGRINRTAFELLGRARGLADDLGQEVWAVLAGAKGLESPAADLFAYGADKVVLAEDEALGPLPHPALYPSAGRPDPAIQAQHLSAGRDPGRGATWPRAYPAAWTWA